MSGSASAAPGSPATASRLLQAPSAKWTFSILLVRRAWIISPERFIEWARPYFAIEPCSDNEHDPTDQDSRTSFPDKARRAFAAAEAAVSSSDSSRSNPVQPAGSWRDIGQGSRQDECKITLAEAEARAGDIDRALAILDETLATSEHIGNRQFDAELYRVCGEMRDPASPPASEESASDRYRGLEAAESAQFRTARGAVAGEALPIDQPARRRARGSPALVGFAATPDIPRIAEAEALLSRLA
jgi:hypothetical protein